LIELLRDAIQLLVHRPPRRRDDDSHDAAVALVALPYHEPVGLHPVEVAYERGGVDRHARRELALAGPVAVVEVDEHLPGREVGAPGPHPGVERGLDDPVGRGDPAPEEILHRFHEIRFMVNK
jgi:hypothetical protein